eukprot:30919-Chlamydomonas_euryale.AAC.1
MERGQKSSRKHKHTQTMAEAPKAAVGLCALLRVASLDAPRNRTDAGHERPEPVLGRGPWPAGRAQGHPLCVAAPGAAAAAQAL